jgi:hypothetical protein
MSPVVQDAIAERATGGRPGRLRAALAAIVAAAACGVVMYRILRSSSGARHGDE